MIKGMCKLKFKSVESLNMPSDAVSYDLNPDDFDVIIRTAGYELHRLYEKGIKNEKYDYEYNVSERNVIALKAAGRTLYVLTNDGRVHLYGSDSFNKVPSDIQLFDDYDKIFEDRRKEEQRKKEEEELKAKRREQGVCQHCGGTFKKGFFSTKCTSCGKSKDY